MFELVRKRRRGGWALGVTGQNTEKVQGGEYQL